MKRRRAAGIAFNRPAYLRYHPVDVTANGFRRRRIALLIALAVAWSGLLVWRLMSLQIYQPDFWRVTARKQHFSEIKIASERGPIYDRNNQLLAVSVPAGSVYVRPAEVRDKGLAAAQLAEVLDLPREKVRALFNSTQPFVWVKRQIPRVYADRVASLKLDGVGYLLESRRFYPYNESASVLIGKVGVDGNGLSGLEALYDRRLSGEQFRTVVTRDALGNMIQDVSAEAFRLPKGAALRLTIDASMQMILDEELAAGREAAAAKAALGVLVDAVTGEVLAMGQAPSANFNDEKLFSHDDMINRVVETVFEPGSIMKPIVAAAALEGGSVTPQEVINCENGRYRFGRHTIKDVHGFADLSFHDVVVRSSNIGMTKVGARLGRDRLYRSLHAFGFGQPVGLGLPGETRGILRRAENWAAVDVATHSFGQGVAVTALHMVRALSAIVNGGYLPELRVIADHSAAPPVKLISDSSAQAVRDMMYAVVEDEHGTGKKAVISGVRIGGKTGTAQKARKDGRGYAPGLYMASFMGFADAGAIGIRKKLALIIVVDEPHAGSIYGGSVAAPVFQKVMKRVLHLLSTQVELNVPSTEGRYDAEEGALLPAAYHY